jgi:uncharacterized membrane protein YraQ (UPF0718 family)
VILDSLRASFDMVWQTLWALALGFSLSGLVQAYVSRARMQRALGTHSPAALGRATFFGAVSSSCSYAASSLAKTLFARGADFTSSMVFMFASTNLVIELGIVLWLLMGWQFALAELIGGLIMITLFALIGPRVFNAHLMEPVRIGLDQGMSHDAPHEPSLADAARYALADLRMLRWELIIGYLVAGVIDAVVPSRVFGDLFLGGHGFWSDLWQVMVGPFIAVISFVCSVGNVPLANALYVQGLSFGGTVAFVFADLITLPLLLVYRRLFGARITARILVTFWAVMSTAGLLVDLIFKSIGVPRPHGDLSHPHVHWDHTTVLNILGLAAFGGLLLLSRRAAAPASHCEHHG